MERCVCAWLLAVLRLRFVVDVARAASTGGCVFFWIRERECVHEREAERVKAEASSEPRLSSSCRNVPWSCSVSRVSVLDHVLFSYFTHHQDRRARSALSHLDAAADHAHDLPAAEPLVAVREDLGEHGIGVLVRTLLLDLLFQRPMKR